MLLLEFPTEIECGQHEIHTKSYIIQFILFSSKLKQSIVSVVSKKEKKNYYLSLSVIL